MSSISGLASGYGLQGWMQAFDGAASAVSAAAQPDASNSDLVDGMVGMGLDADGVKASISVLRTADEMLGTVIDLLG